MEGLAILFLAAAVLGLTGIVGRLISGDKRS
jgi:hypothetical protein